MATDLQDLEHAAGTYIDGLCEGDTAKPGLVFHEESHLFSVTGGKLDDMPRAVWFAMVRDRPSMRNRESTPARLGRAHRPLRSEYRVRQGAMPNSIALFHGSFDIREPGGPLAGHCQNIPHRNAIILPPDRHRKRSHVWPCRRVMSACPRAMTAAPVEQGTIDAATTFLVRRAPGRGGFDAWRVQPDSAGIAGVSGATANHLAGSGLVESRAIHVSSYRSGNSDLRRTLRLVRRA